MPLLQSISMENALSGAQHWSDPAVLLMCTNAVGSLCLRHFDCEQNKPCMCESARLFDMSSMAASSALTHASMHNHSLLSCDKNNECMQCCCLKAHSVGVCEIAGTLPGTWGTQFEHLSNVAFANGVLVGELS